MNQKDKIQPAYRQNRARAWRRANKTPSSQLLPHIHARPTNRCALKKAVRYSVQDRNTYHVVVIMQSNQYSSPHLERSGGNGEIGWAIFSTFHVTERTPCVHHESGFSKPKENRHSNHPVFCFAPQPSFPRQQRRLTTLGCRNAWVHLQPTRQRQRQTGKDWTRRVKSKSKSAQ